MRHIKTHVAWLMICLLLNCSTTVGRTHLARAPHDETTADKYEAYVTSAIQLSKEYAQRDAKFREFSVFWQQISDAQRDMSSASDATLVFNELIPHVVEGTDFKQADGSPDLKQLIEQTLIADQMTNAVTTVENSLQEYSKIVAGLPTACDKSFDDYDVERVLLDFTTPEVETADGIFVIVPTGEVVTTVVTVAFSIWQIFSNVNEQQRIREQTERLRNERVKTPEYRQDGLTACRSFIPAFQGFLEEYRPLVDAYQQWLQTIPAAGLRERHKLLRQQFDIFAARFAADMEAQARKAVRDMLRAKNDTDNPHKMSIRANIRIARNVQALRAAPCEATTEITEELNADVALAKLYQLSSTLTLVPGVENAISAKQTSCNFSQPLSNNFLRSGARSLRAKRGKVGSQSPLRAHSIFAPPIKACIVGGGYAFDSFCKELQGRGMPAGSHGVYTSEFGGVCGYSSRTSVGNYDLCNASLFSQGDAVGDVWAAARTIIATADHIPGRYSAARGERNGDILDKNLQELTERSNQLKQIFEDLSQDAHNHFTSNVPASINASIGVVEQLGQTAQQQLTPLLNNLPATEPGSPPSENSIAEISSGPLRERIRVIEIEQQQGNPVQVWRQLEGISIVAQDRLAELPIPDRQAVLGMTAKFFDSNGVINEQFLGGREGLIKPADFAHLAETISANLRTDPATSKGRMLRQQLNRGLVASAAAGDPSLIQYELGALGIFSGADIAISDGSDIDGARLIMGGLIMTDVVLGIVPIASSLNDGAQIVYGISTGYDNTGHRMRAGDYALRGIGVVIGLLPVANDVVKIGSSTLNNSFRVGANAIRDFGLGNKIAVASRQVPSAAEGFVEIIGQIAETTHGDPTTLARTLDETINAEARLANSPSGSWLSNVWVPAREVGHVAADGGHVLVDQASPAINALATDGVYARVISPQRLRQLTSGDRLLAESVHNEAHITAAEDLRGFTDPADIAKRVGLYEDPLGNTLRDIRGYSIIEFRFVDNEILSVPVNFDPTSARRFGWISGGRTVGGAREWLIDADALRKHLIQITGIRQIPRQPPL